MPKLKEGQLPKYRLHKQSGQAIVTLSGRDLLLGPYGSPASRQKYKRLTGEWLAAGAAVPNGSSIPAATASRPTVAEVAAAFWRHAQQYYRDADGCPTSEVENFRQALRALNDAYGDADAQQFGPLALGSVASRMVELGWCRTNINRHVSRIKMVFKWAVANELLPPAVHHGLAAVNGLRRGRSAAREAEPVKPVPEERVFAIRPYVASHVWAMVELQLLTGMRPGEVVAMRECDINRAGEIWTYTPRRHKTAHHGHDRTIYLGPKAQSVLQPFLVRDPTVPLFSPAEAEAERRAVLASGRKTPMNCGNRPGKNRKRKPTRAPGAGYDVAAYRRAIARACEKAFSMPDDLRDREDKEHVAALAAMTAEQRRDRQRTRAQWRAVNVWHPHQLRHNAATRLRREFGLEAAQVILGHRTLAVTQVYAEKNAAAAINVMARAG